MDALARIQPYAAGTGSAITEVMMGLDTVELVMAFEEAFELEIPNAEAERMRTVRDVVDYIAKQKSLEPNGSCAAQVTFNQLRRALEIAAPHPEKLAPSTPLSALTDRDGWGSLWRTTRLCSGQEDWPADVPWERWRRRGPTTVGELVLFLIPQLPRRLHPEATSWTRNEILQIVCQVLYEEQGIWKVHLDDSFVGDLRLD